ncbi:MAG: hypothetical protein INR64_00975 [Caulobacteraceae bacterium]|nr:hypothetical protein [Caulobacter sp.]
MNTDFTRYSLDGARNEEGTVVRGLDRELMSYERNGFNVFIKVFVVDGSIVAYQPPLPSPLPTGMTREDVYAEIRAGISAATAANTVWKTG